MTGAMEVIEGIVSVFLNRVPGYRIRDSEYRSGLRNELVDCVLKSAAAWIPPGGISRFRAGSLEGFGDPWGRYSRPQQDRSEF